MAPKSGVKSFAEIVGEVAPDRRSRIEAIKIRSYSNEAVSSLAELRQHRGMTQEQLAKKLGRTQSTVSSMERLNSDNRMSTWRRVIEAMDGRLEVIAIFGDKRVLVSDLIEEIRNMEDTEHM